MFDLWWGVFTLVLSNVCAHDRVWGMGIACPIHPPSSKE